MLNVNQSINQSSQFRSCCIYEGNFCTISHTQRTLVLRRIELRALQCSIKFLLYPCCPVVQDEGLLGLPNIAKTCMQGRPLDNQIFWGNGEFMVDTLTWGVKQLCSVATQVKFHLCNKAVWNNVLFRGMLLSIITHTLSVLNKFVILSPSKKKKKKTSWTNPLLSSSLKKEKLKIWCTNTLDRMVN